MVQKLKRTEVFNLKSSAFFRAVGIIIALSVASSQPEALLTFDARCFLNDEDLPCSAAQWTQGGSILEQTHLEAAGRTWSLQTNDSCLLSPAQTTETADSDRIAVVRRGGCSFGTKALTAQQRGFSALIIVDSSSSDITPPPPGLGMDSTSIFIPVVMVSSAWAGQLGLYLDETAEDPSCAQRPRVAVSLSIPDENELWNSSPWYEETANISLSHTPVGTRRYTLVCDRASPVVSNLSDDDWLLKRWLKELAAEPVNQTPSTNARGVGCFEIGKMKNVVVWEKETSLSHIPGGIFQGGDGECGFALVRLPQFDARGETMEDLDILLDEDDNVDRAHSHSGSPTTTQGSQEFRTFKPARVLHVLRGLNSNSHRFPWGGRNTYPRFFESGALLVRRGSVLLDGVVVAHQSQGCPQSVADDDPSHQRWSLTAPPVAEFHYGGCGCCPLGHGEIGKTFDIRDEEAVVVRHEAKLVTLVQRFHHVYYHVVMEVLARLLQVHDLVTRDRSWRVLVDLSGGPFVREYLEDVFGLLPDQIVPFSAQERVFADLLVAPAPLPCGHVPRALTLQLHSLLSKWKNAQLLLADQPLNDDDDVGEEASSSASNHGLVVADQRGGCRPKVLLVLKRLGSRSVENHEEVVRALEQEFSSQPRSHDGDGDDDEPQCFFFQVRELEASGLSVTEQARAFAAADVLVAPHGSGLANALFMAAPASETNLTTHPTRRGPDPATPIQIASSLSGSSGGEGCIAKFPVVIELLPWEYPNLTFYVALEWLRPVLRHAVCLVPGGNAYRPMRVNARSLARQIRRYLHCGQQERGS